AGDDGVYALELSTGSTKWHFKELLHIDASPTVVAGRLYLGSGISRTRKTTQALCLDAKTGQVLWLQPTDLPVWGSPTVDGDSVFFGRGNGRLDSSAAHPAGGILCLDAKNGAVRWRFDVAEGVLARPTLDARTVYFGARDGRCYALDRVDGSLRWTQDLGSAIVTTPALANGALYVAASAGKVSCLEVESGHVRWSFDVAAHTQTRPRLFASPVVVEKDGARHIYLGTELRNGVSSAAVLYCLSE